jgi:hypothetical protein
MKNLDDLSFMNNGLDEGGGSNRPAPVKGKQIQMECLQRGLIIETAGRFVA